MLLRARVILIMIAIILFFKFYKGYDEFEEMSLDSKYNSMKEFNKLLISFKSVKTKKPRNTTQKGANYEKCWRALRKCYYNAYKSDHDTDGELKEDKKKKFDYKQFELGDEINKESKLDEKTKQFEIIDNRDQGPKSTKKKRPRQKTLMKYKTIMG